MVEGEVMERAIGNWQMLSRYGIEILKPYNVFCLSKCSYFLTNLCWEETFIKRSLTVDFFLVPLQNI